MTKFKFEVTQRVALTESGETGKIVARAEYDSQENQYLIRYKAGDGRQVEQWWGESAVKEC